MVTTPPSTKKKGRHRDKSQFDLRSHLYRITGVDFTSIDGLDVLTVQTIILGAFYRRIKARAGAPKAITATAHKIARLYYTLWTKKESYLDLGAEYYEQRYKERVIKNLKQRAKSFGLDLVELSSA